MWHYLFKRGLKGIKQPCYLEEALLFGAFLVKGVLWNFLVQFCYKKFDDAIQTIAGDTGFYKNVVLDSDS